MTAPRQVLPGRFYLITRRCTQRQFLLRPDDATNNAFLYCLAEAAQRFELEIILPSVMSNHHHTVMFDRHGRVSEFMEHFHKMLARTQNALRGRSENLWSTDEPSAVELVEVEDVIAKIVYAATNPVLSDLVESVRHWPGVNGLRALLEQKELKATRPRHFFSPDGVMPERVTLSLRLPPELGDEVALLAIIEQQVRQTELACRERRQQRDRRIVGRARVLRQSWRDSPTTPDPQRRLKPRVAAINVAARIAALQRLAAFAAEYRDARQRWLAGLTALFPAGTYWLRRFAAVPVAVA